MSTEEGICVHDVVTPRRVLALPIVEGHVALLRGTCGLCNSTVVGIDLGQAVRWVAVSDIVEEERGYHRPLVVDPLLGLPLAAAQPEPVGGR